MFTFRTLDVPLMGINLEKGNLIVPIARETHCMYRLVCLHEVIYVCGRFDLEELYVVISYVRCT